MKIKSVFRILFFVVSPLFVLCCAFGIRFMGLQFSVILKFLLFDHLLIETTQVVRTTHLTLENRKNRLIERIDRLVKVEEYYPSIQYAMYDQDSNEWIKYSTGYEDILDSPLKEISDTTTFNVASVTKIFTGLALFVLDKGQQDFSIEDLVSKHIEHPFNQTMTVRHLITHTSGINEPLFPISEDLFHAKPGRFESQKSLKEFLKRTSSSEVGVFKYSNCVGYWLLATVIEEVSGMSYEEYVLEKIIKISGSFLRTNFDVLSETRGHLWKYNPLYPISNFILPKIFFPEELQNDSFNPRDESIRFYPLRKLFMNGNSFGGLISNCEEIVNILKYFLFEKYHPFSEHEEKMKLSFLDFFGIGTIEEQWDKNRPFYQKLGGGVGFSASVRVYKEERLSLVLLPIP